VHFDLGRIVLIKETR